MRRAPSRSLTAALGAGLVLSAAATAQADDGSSGKVFHTKKATVRVLTSHVKPLATIGGVEISGGAYGSAITMKPGSTRVFYGLTDRGLNVDGPNGT